jgi:hypothetical protein
MRGGSEIKVNILVDDIIGHYEKKSPYEHMSNAEYLPM